jgi:hypothetical protein
MLTDVDHVSVSVADLRQGIETFTALGFEVRHRPGDPAAYVCNPADAIELVATGEPLGLRYIAIAREQPPDQLIADQLIASELPLRFVTRSTPRAEPPAAHPNGVLHLDRTYIAVRDVHSAAESYARALDLPVPPVQRGNVIKAEMCIFQVGHVGIGVAQPVEPGPAAEALDRQGPGPFQVLFRVRSLSAAEHWMSEHGIHALRGTRNTGESAMLVPPKVTGGVYVAFVGPE